MTLYYIDEKNRNPFAIPIERMWEQALLLPESDSVIPNSPERQRFLNEIAEINPHIRRTPESHRKESPVNNYSAFDLSE